MRAASAARTVAAMEGALLGQRASGAADRRSSLATGSGAVLGLGGLAFLAVGLWARRTVAQTLARERIVDPGSNGRPSAPVTSGGAARALTETIRSSALAAAGGRTYAETEASLAADGEPTSDADSALKDERTGVPVENPKHALWLQATTLETALLQAYLAFRLADLTIALGGVLTVAGVGLAATGGARR